MCFGQLGTDGAECSKKVASERRVAGAIRSLVNARDLLLECLNVLEACMKHCLYLFLCIAVKQYFGRRRDLLGL